MTLLDENNEEEFVFLNEDTVKDYAFAICCVPTIATYDETEINQLIEQLNQHNWAYSSKLVTSIKTKNKNLGYYDLLA